MLENKWYYTYRGRESVFDNKTLNLGTMVAYMINKLGYGIIDYTSARLHGYAPSLGPSLRAERRCVLCISATRMT